MQQSPSLEEAVERAEAEAHEYAHDTSSAGDTTVFAGLQQAYLLADSPSDGAEVYSLIRGTDLAPRVTSTRYSTRAPIAQGPSPTTTGEGPTAP